MARARPAPGRSDAQQLRCLIVERHDWETGAYTHQLQFPLEAARTFFGPDATDMTIRVRMFDPPEGAVTFLQDDLTVSRRYGQSGTRRTNRLPAIGDIPPSFVFLEETNEAGVHNVWWNIDKAIVAAHFHPWRQAKSSQYGRGRLFIIVPASVPRVLARV